MEDTRCIMQINRGISSICSLTLQSGKAEKYSTLAKLKYNKNYNIKIKKTFETVALHLSSLWPNVNGECVRRNNKPKRNSRKNSFHRFANGSLSVWRCNVCMCIIGFGRDTKSICSKCFCAFNFMYTKVQSIHS
jgi:hypothetical protein